MHAFGSDRVRRGSAEQWIISSPYSKGWVARTPETLVSRDRPGTAVLWEERYYEVVTATGEGAGVRYVLEPWRDEHVMRVVDAYDEAAEKKRIAEHRAMLAREKNRRAVTFLSMLSGHLPARVQEKMGHELGVLPARMTLISLLLSFVVIASLFLYIVHRRMTEGAVPIWMVLLAAALAVESAIRLNFAMVQNRPMGSVAGFLAYSVIYLTAPKGRLTSPVDAPSKSVLKVDMTRDMALNDAYIFREPFLTLLSPPEQKFLEQRFGFNYRRSGPTVAITILLFATIGAVTSFMALTNGGGLSALLSLITASGLAVEQVVRLNTMRRTPAASVLGALVRPWSKKLFA